MGDILFLENKYKSPAPTRHWPASPSTWSLQAPGPVIVPVTQPARPASLLSLVGAGPLLPQGLGAGCSGLQRSAHGGLWSHLSPPLPVLPGPGLQKAHPIHPQIPELP